MKKDKRDECGCHRTCTVMDHECQQACAWPSCLTPMEAAELAAEIMREFENG